MADLAGPEINKEAEENAKKTPLPNPNLRRTSRIEKKNVRERKNAVLCHSSLENVSEDQERAHDTPVGYPENSGNWMKNSNVLIPFCFFLINVV